MRKTLGFLVMTISFWSMLSTGWAQTSAWVGLDGSGNLVLNAELEFEETTPPEFDGTPWNQTTTPTGTFSFIYFDLRMSDYDNGFESSQVSDLATRWNCDPWCVNNSKSDFIKDGFFMGLYDFGETDFGTPTGSFPDIELDGENTYYSSAASVGVDNSDDGLLSLKASLPFDASVTVDYSPDTFYLKDENGSTITSAVQNHQFEDGSAGTGTGTWISTSAAANIKSHGLVSGDYEFLTYVEFHEKSGSSIEIISAFQNEIAYARFTIQDENTSTLPTMAITESTVIVGEDGIKTGSSFTISGGANVDFIVANGDGIELEGGFEIAVGSTMDTILDGGDALPKNGTNSNQEVVMQPELELPEVDSHFLSVYPNPGSGDARLRLRASGAELMVIRVYDALGRMLADDAIHVSGEYEFETSLSTIFDGARLPPGMYFIRVSSQGISSTKSVIML